MSRRRAAATVVRPILLALFGMMACTPAWADPGSDDGGTFALFATLWMALGIYLIPTVVAFHRQHPNRWVILGINIVFGETGLGWIGALLWASTAIHRSPTGNHGGESGLNLFVNDPKTVRVEGLSMPPPVPPTAPVTEALGDQLERLASLHERGLIDDEEHASLRRAVLDRAIPG